MEPASNNPLHVFLGFVAGVGWWLLAFVIQVFAIGLFGYPKFGFAVSPVILAGCGVYFFRRRRERPAFTTGVLIAVCLGFLISSACGIQITTHGLGG